MVSVSAAATDETSEIDDSSTAVVDETREIVGSSTAVVDETTTWRYLDDNTDPAGDAAAADYSFHSWTAADFDDSAWKTAAGTFGCKNGALTEVSGYTPTVLLNQYIDGDSANGDIPTAFPYDLPGCSCQ